MKENRQPNPDDSVGFFHSGARSRAGGEWQETRPGGGDTPGARGAPATGGDPPWGRGPELPCNSRAHKGLSASWFVLFFSYSSLIFNTEIKFLSISKGFAFAAQARSLPCPARGSSAAFPDAFECDGMLVLTRWSSVFLLADTLKFQLFLFSCVIQPKFSL